MTAATMRAVELPGVGERLRVVERPVPEPGPGEVRVRVEACGVCGSDLFLQDGGFALQCRDGTHGTGFPVVPGHEAAGTVDALGPGVEGLEIGQQVAVYYVDPDPEGAYAARGRENVDPAVTRMGVEIDGAFAEYVVRPAHTLIVPPQRIDPAALAVLTDAVATPYHALARRALVQPRETVVVLGIGGLGSNAVQIAKALGARVVAVSRQQVRLDLATKLGADVVVQSDDDVVAQVLAATDGGADVVVQCASAPQLDEQAVAMVRAGGRVAYVGVSKRPFEVLAADLIWREISLLGSCRFTRQDIRDVIDLYLDGQLVVDHLLTRTRPLEEANEALEDLRTGTVLRSVLVP